MPPSPTHITTYAADALSLLTSRYSKARPGSLITASAAATMQAMTLSGAANVFNPKSLTGIAAWFRADLGITIATGVSAWADQSGTGDANKNLSQATTTKQPAFNAADASYKGRPTLGLASASTQFLASGTWASPLAQPYTMIVIGNDDGTVTEQAYIDNEQGPISESAIVSDAGIYQLFAGAFLGSSTAVSSAPRVMIATFDATSTLYINARTHVASGNAGNGSRTGLTVGASVAATLPLNGKIAEVICYSRALNSTEIGQLLDYAGALYGIPIGA